jgi:hypothetical protein
MTTDIDRELRETLAERQADLHPSPVAPEGFLRRARRRVVRNVVLGLLTVTVVVVGSTGAIKGLIEGNPDPVPGGGDRTALPTQGPTPGETSLLLASGEQDGEPWALRVTSSRSPATGSVGATRIWAPVVAASRRCGMAGSSRGTEAARPRTTPTVCRVLAGIPARRAEVEDEGP